MCPHTNHSHKKRKKLLIQFYCNIKTETSAQNKKGNIVCSKTSLKGFFFPLSESSEIKPELLLDGVRNTGPAACQLKYNKSTLFQVLDNYPGVTRKLMRVLVKCVKVCQDKCGALSHVEHREKPAWLLRMWIWITCCMCKQV